MELLTKNQFDTTISCLIRSSKKETKVELIQQLLCSAHAIANDGHGRGNGSRFGRVMEYCGGGANGKAIKKWILLNAGYEVKKTDGHWTVSKDNQGFPLFQAVTSHWTSYLVPTTPKTKTEEPKPIEPVSPVSLAETAAETVADAAPIAAEFEELEVNALETAKTCVEALNDAEFASFHAWFMAVAARRAAECEHVLRLAA